MIKSVKDLKAYEDVFTLIDECTDNYVFVYDLENDLFHISKSALDTFTLEEEHIKSASSALKPLVYPKDWDKLAADIRAVRNQEKAQHDLEYRLITKDDEIIWVSGKSRTFFNEQGKPSMLMGCICEIGKHNKYDNITSLYCEDVLKERYALAKITEPQPVTGTILLIGIDNFREINEKYGTKMGDILLAGVAEAIAVCCKNRENVFRFHGDEFAVILKEQPACTAADAKKLYKAIRRKIDSSIERNGYHMFFTISGGAASFNTQEDSYEDVLKNAKFALHVSKLNGKNTFTPYSEDEYLSYIRRIDIQEELRKCVADNFKGFEVYYQPIMKPQTHTLYGSEALIRWRSEKYGFMSPVDFVPLLEESALIIPLGKWIIENAVRQCKAWVSVYPDFVMNINLSFVQIIKSDILKDAVELLEQYELSAEHVVFEVTESGELENNTAVKHVLNSFNNRSLNLAIDDFGTGYSNLRYIRDMMFGIIKIDRLFIKDINESSQNYTLVKYVTEMAHNFNIKVCVEGVETQEEYDKVMTLKPDCIQGFFYGKPMNAGNFAASYI